jgi:hypothetical protein
MYLVATQLQRLATAFWLAAPNYEFLVSFDQKQGMDWLALRSLAARPAAQTWVAQSQSESSGVCRSRACVVCHYGRALSNAACPCSVML